MRTAGEQYCTLYLPLGVKQILRPIHKQTLYVPGLHTHVCVRMRVCVCVVCVHVLPELTLLTFSAAFLSRPSCCAKLSSI